MNLTFPLARAALQWHPARFSPRFDLEISQPTCNIIPIFLLQFRFYTAGSMMFAVFQNINSLPIDL